MYDVKVYSLKAEGSRQITDHFRVYEFACKDGSDVVFAIPATGPSATTRPSAAAAPPASTATAWRLTSGWKASAPTACPTTPNSCWAITAA